MRTVMFFIAGAMYLSTVFADDPGYEERYRMKMGRYTPAEEARREAARIAAKESRAKPVMNCVKHSCCANEEAQATVAKSTLGDPSAEARFRMKFGRNSPAEERRVAAAKPVTNELVIVATARMCESDCCKHRL